jgi:hypothetical protein
MRAHMRIVLCLALALASTGLACDSGSASEPVRPVARAVEVPSLRPSRGRVIGGEAVRRTIHWPDDSHLDPRISSLPAAVSGSLQELPVPALLPDDERWWDTAVVVSSRHHLAISSSHEGATLVVSGSALARLYPHLTGDDASQGDRGRPLVTRNENVWHASWVENGAAYSLEVACDKNDDLRCADDGFVRRTVETLVYVGGAS